MAVEKIYIVTAQDVIDDTEIGSAVDSKFISQNILMNQDLKIQTYLGTVLFEKILTDIKNSSLAGNYLTLRDKYIRPCLVYFAAADACILSSEQSTNKGIAKKDGDSSRPADTDRMLQRRNRYNDIGEAYAQKLITYLKNNTSTFPEYEQNTDATDVKPVKNAYTSGIYLGGTRPKR